MADSRSQAPRWNLDVAIVGAGLAGIYALHRLRSLGFGVRCFEAASGIGGTWYWNRYPGARCDVESLQYSYSFDENLQQEWEWTERFATQPEILRYIEHVAERFDLHTDIQLDTRIASAIFDEARSIWTLRTTSGDVIEARYCVMATGTLSAAVKPDFPGLSSFRGEVYHTGTWPHHPVDFTGKHVAAIGTGSSGIQAIPEIAKQAKHLHVFQRTPNFSVPARNSPLNPETVRCWKSNYAELRRRAREETRSGMIFDKFATKGAMEVGEDERQREYTERWEKGGPDFMQSFNDLIFNEQSNATAAEFLRAQIRNIVKDPDLAETLCPRDYPVFAKRLCVDTDYFETFNRDNVTLVDLRKAAITTITPEGIETAQSAYAFDVIVLATGFDAITGPLGRIDIHGRGGRKLTDKWRDGPMCYLGLLSAGFPNMFTINGPGSPAVFGNIVVSIEFHVKIIADLMVHMRQDGSSTIDADSAAEEAWMAYVSEVASATLYPRAASWYMGANIPGKPRVFMAFIGGVNVYRAKVLEAIADGHRGFVFDAPRGERSEERGRQLASL